jgi:coenzyme PQQ precursor peptide PqqA
MLELSRGRQRCRSCDACAPTQGNQVLDSTDPRRPKMKWHTPKIVEIACGGEINAYFPAEL